MAKIPSLNLSNNLEIPMIGFGTNKLKGNCALEAIKAAIDCGYRCIDTAYVYGNEKEVGEAIREKIKKGVVQREDIFLVTKLASIHHSKVEYGCKLSLERLGLDFIDLYLVHSPWSFKYRNDEDTWPKLDNGETDIIDIDLLDIWQQMEYLVDKGLVKSIGVSNFNSVQMKHILNNCRIKPVINEIECNPGFDQTKLINFCKEKGVEILAYSPLAHPNSETKQPSYLFDENVNKIASKYKKTAAQVVLRYSVELGVVPIPKSGNINRIYENFDIFDFKLTKEEMQYMKTFQNPENRVYKFSNLAHVKNFPFNVEF